jgi:hypothetical protein
MSARSEDVTKRAAWLTVHNTPENAPVQGEKKEWNL